VNVLRILRHDLGSRRVLLTLQGNIAGEWAGVLERECLNLGRFGLAVVLDLSGVIFIGRSGVEVLRSLARAGAGLIGCSPLIADVLEQEGIAVERAPGDERNGKAQGKERGEEDPSD
jgi:anti-anti-sigma regulatory factor